VVEKDGDLENNFVPQIKHKRGNIVCLQNLLPNSENDEQQSDVYCHMYGIASVTMLNLDYLKHVLLEDKEKLLKLWKIIAHRLIVINHERLPQFHSLTRDRIQILCKMCEYRMYNPGDSVDMRNGGVVFRGSVQKLTDRLDIIEQKLKETHMAETAKTQHKSAYY
jgi:gamma-glutamylcyclotransferase (GGCT)/AIG2-like uncharacterized protein YtfP